MYSEQADAAQTLEAATQAIDTKQLSTDITAPLTDIKDALSNGISRMMASEARGPRGHSGYHSIGFGSYGGCGVCGGYGYAGDTLGQTGELLGAIAVIFYLFGGIGGKLTL